MGAENSTRSAAEAGCVWSALRTKSRFKCEYLSLKFGSLPYIIEMLRYIDTVFEK